MTTEHAAQETTDRLVAFIRDRLAGPESGKVVDPSTPLLNGGLLTSLNTAILLNFVREEFGIVLPVTEITAANFRDARTLGALVARLRAQE